MQENFHYAVVIVIVFSLIPVAYEVGKHKYEAHMSKRRLKHANYKEIKETIKEVNEEEN